MSLDGSIRTVYIVVNSEINNLDTVSETFSFDITFLVACQTTGFTGILANGTLDHTYLLEALMNTIFFETISNGECNFTT